MESFVLQIRNYQRIRKANLEFVPGLNVIVGSSNNGKSAIFRAIQTAVFNLSRDSHITMGESASGVGIKYNGHQIIWKRNKNSAVKTTYLVDGKPFSKVGRLQLDEVADSLGISEVEIDDSKERLNFQKQMSYPFLLGKTPSQIFKFMAQSAEEDNLLEVLDKMKTDYKSISAEIVKNQASADTLKKSLEREQEALSKVSKKSDVCSKVLSLDSQVQNLSRLGTILSNIQKYKNLSEESSFRVQSYSEKLSKFSSIVDIVNKNLQELNLLESRVSAVKTPLDKLLSTQLSCEKLVRKTNILAGLSNCNPQELTKLYAMYSKAVNSGQSVLSSKVKIDSIQNSLEGLSKKLSFLNSRIIEGDARSIDLSKLERMMSVLDVSNRNKADILIKINKLEKQLQQIEEALSEYKICPFCGSHLIKE